MHKHVNQQLTDAALHGRTKVVRSLLALKADANARGQGWDIERAEGLRMAAKNGHTDTVRVLLAHKADVHACGPDWDDGKPDAALRWAAYNGSTDTVRVLLAHKADVHACGPDWDGGSKPDHALRYAARYHYTETVRVLLQAQANPILLPALFVDKHLNCRAYQVANLGLGLRLGDTILRTIPNSSNGLMRSFQTARAAYVELLSKDMNCRDVCELALSYV